MPTLRCVEKQTTELEEATSVETADRPHTVQVRNINEISVPLYRSYHGFMLCIRGIRTLIKEKGSKAALLVIHLCSVECRMTLENDNLDEVSSCSY